MYRLDCPVIFTHICLSSTFSPRTIGPKHAGWSRKTAISWPSCSHVVVRSTRQVRRQQLKLFRATELDRKEEVRQNSKKNGGKAVSRQALARVQAVDLGLIPALSHGAEPQITPRLGIFHFRRTLACLPQGCWKTRWGSVYHAHEGSRIKHPVFLQWWIEWRPSPIAQNLCVQQLIMRQKVCTTTSWLSHLSFAF